MPFLLFRVADQSGSYSLRSHSSFTNRYLVARQREGAELGSDTNDKERETDFKQVSLGQAHRHEERLADVKLHQPPAQQHDPAKIVRDSSTNCRRSKWPMVPS
jgi:hypothetical protein